MAGKRQKPEELRIEASAGWSSARTRRNDCRGAASNLGGTGTFFRWRKLYGGMQRPQLAWRKEVEKENQGLRRAVSDLTLDKLILTEAAKGNVQARHVVVSASTLCGGSWRVRAGLGQHRFTQTQRKVPQGRADEQRLSDDIIKLADQYGRYGYRMVTGLLNNAGACGPQAG